MVIGERLPLEPVLGPPPLRPRRLVPLCDTDREFARRIPEADLPMARRRLLVPVCVVPPGAWFVDEQTPGRCGGFVVLKGTLLHDSRVDEHWSTEILGPQDVLQPWQELEPPLGVTTASRWRMLEPTHLALLDGRFTSASVRWPELLEELVARGVRRARLLAALLAVAQIRRLDDRLVLLLRILADRWGRVRADGVELRIQLTHETLAHLVGARRPSVSAAVARLERRGVLSRDGRRFLLPSRLFAR